MEGFKKENFGMSILNVLNKVSVLLKGEILC